MFQNKTGILLFSGLCLFSQFFSYIIRKSSFSNLAIKAIKYEGIAHCGVVVKNVEASKRFYLEVFGCSDVTFRRPNLPFRGAFLQFGSNEIHLMELENCDPTTGRPSHAGRDRHIALTVNSISLIQDNLDKENIPYTFSQSGRRALFCRDLDGNGFEFVEDPAVS